MLEGVAADRHLSEHFVADPFWSPQGHSYGVVFVHALRRSWSSGVFLGHNVQESVSLSSNFMCPGDVGRSDFHATRQDPSMTTMCSRRSIAISNTVRSLNDFFRICWRPPEVLRQLTSCLTTLCPSCTMFSPWPLITMVLVFGRAWAQGSPREDVKSIPVRVECSHCDRRSADLALQLRTHSLSHPYLDSDMQSRWFDYGGDAIVRTDKCVLDGR